MAIATYVCVSYICTLVPFKVQKRLKQTMGKSYVFYIIRSQVTLTTGNNAI